MKYKVKGMTIFIEDTYEAMSKRAAQIVASQITIKPNCILGLATGGTPIGMYDELRKMYENNDIDFSEVKSFNLDEYYPLSKENEQSYYYYMNTHFFKHINMQANNIDIPNGEAHDVEKECTSYDQRIYNSGGIDLQVLGIGNNGHIGFNEPDVHFESGTHLVELDEETIVANARFFDNIEKVPRQAISMGIRTIMHSKKIILLANGKNKAEILEKMLFGDIIPLVPASILQLHNDVTLIIDREAGKKIGNHI